MIRLYFSVASRSFVPLWLLEEIGTPYEIVDTDIRDGRHKAPDYLKVNPMGKVPALDDGGTIVSEVPAICLYLADKYSYGALAPKIEDPLRGPYLKWCVFATAVFEPATYLPPSTGKDTQSIGWGNRDTALNMLEDALTTGPWLLGECFSAADVVLGGLFAIAFFNRRVDQRAAFAAYNARLAARPAFQRAGEINWPPSQFPR
jgi:glutathione S-transferase